MNSKKAFKNILFNLAAQIGIMICGFIMPRIIIENYGSETNGLVASITQFLGYITLLEAGMGPAIKAALYKPIAKLEKEKIAGILNESERFFKIISRVFIVYLTALAFIYPLIASSSFDYVFSFSLVIIISISTFAEYYFGMTYRLFLQAEQRGYIISILQILTYALATIATVILSHCGASIQILKLVTGMVFVLRPILQNIYVKKNYNFPKPLNNHHYIKQKKDSLAQHVASIINDNTDIAILTIFSTLDNVSVYSVYCFVTKGIKTLIDSIVTAISPTFGNLIVKNDQGLEKKFNAFETIMHTITTIFFGCAIILITPFVQVYTSNITDCNYLQPLFGILICLATFAWCVRLPYNSITLAAGHFKETRKGAWIEAGTNIILSIILVWNFGLIGVAIGTLVAMIIRTTEFVYHSNKYIIKRDNKKSIQKILIIILELITITSTTILIKMPEMTSYFTWLIYAVKIFAITITIVLPINVLLFKNDFEVFLEITKKVLKRSKK